MYLLKKLISTALVPYLSLNSKNCKHSQKYVKPLLPEIIFHVIKTRKNVQQRNETLLPDFQTLDVLLKMLHYKCSTHFYGRFLTVSLYGGVSLNCHNNSQLKSDLKDLFKTAQAAPEKIENTECQCRLNEKNEDVCIAAAMMRSV